MLKSLNILLLFSTLFTFNAFPNFSQTDKLTADDREANAFLGSSIAVSGDVMAVGAYGESEGASSGQLALPKAGAVYLYRKDANGAWVQHQKLVASDREKGAHFGVSVALFGDDLVVGAHSERKDENGQNPLSPQSYPGAVYIFHRDNNNQWTEVKKLVANDRADVTALFGSSVSIYGDSIAVGAPQESRDAQGANMIGSAGAVYLFHKNSNGEWVHQQKLVASSRYGAAKLGTSVSLFEESLVAGAPGDSTSQGATGSLYIFEKSNNSWSQIQKVTGSNLDNFAQLGHSVDHDDQYIIAGAPAEGKDSAGLPSSSLNHAGAVYIFDKTSSLWTEVEKVVASDRQAHDSVGWSVALDQNFFAVGSSQGTSGSGSAYLFERNSFLNSGWNETQKVQASDAKANAHFGWSVALSANVFAVGAKQETEDSNQMNPLVRSGAAYVFQQSSLVSNEDSFLSVSLYPNPTQGQFSIDLGTFHSEVTIEILNMNGQVILIKRIENAQKIPLEILASSGPYLVRVRTPEGKNFHSRIIKI